MMTPPQRLSVLLTFLALAGLSAPAPGDGPFLVRDLNVAPTNGDGVARLDGAVLNGTLFYAARHPRLGLEVWSSDGTPEGTRLLRDVCPGACNSAPADFIVFGGRLFFTAADGVFGREPWTSDGTPEGTRLLRDTIPGPEGTRNARGRVAATDERLAFIVEAPGATELWTSDGSRGGTRRVIGCPSCGEPDGLIGAASRLYFLLIQGEHDPVTELWTSDGTAAGTRRLVADCRACVPLGTVGERLLFRRDDVVHGLELWTSDGTVAGTGLLLDACPIPCDGYPNEFVVTGGRALFTAASALHAPRDLYRTDGTASGTERVLDGQRDGLNGVSQPVLWRGALYFVSVEARRRVPRLWSADLDFRQVELVAARSSTIESLTVAGDRLFFLSSVSGTDELWTSDGTWGGTRSLTIRTGLRDLRSAGDGVFYLADDETLGRELWTSDGTAAGTRLLVDGNVDPGSSSPRQLTSVDERLLFVADADDGLHRFWRSDGTSAGTVPAGHELHVPFELHRFGDGVVYTNTSATPLAERGLWLSDGSPLGTTLLRADLTLATGFVRAGNRTIFAADGVDGVELWATDGTPEGTYLVRDINPGLEPSVILPCCANSSAPRDLLAVGHHVGFAAADAPFGVNVELWRSDGTEQGTAKIAEICPGDDCDASPSDLTFFKGRVYFAAADGETGRELWRTNGTANGTRRVLDLVPGARGSAPHDLFVLAGRLLFFARQGQGERLWASDGTAEGTAEVHRLVVEGKPSFMTDGIALGGRFFFVAANEATGPELWVTDGTTIGTLLVRDLHAGPLGSYPGSLTPVGDLLVFAADDGEAGREPWVSDGTAEGTRRLADVAPGAAASNPADFAVVGSTLYFSADSSDSGRELWALALDSLVPGEAQAQRVHRVRMPKRRYP